MKSEETKKKFKGKKKSIKNRIGVVVWKHYSDIIIVVVVIQFTVFI